MQTTVILFQTPKLGNITRIIYCKNLNCWELFEIMLTKNLCSYSRNLLQTLENLLVVSFIVNKEPTVYR